MNYNFKYIDFTKLIKENDLTRKWFVLEKKHKIERAIKSFPRPCIAFLGSGDYHYLTYFLIKNLSYKPYLILFDNHFDMDLTPKGILSCGSWVREALKDNIIQGVIVVGAAVTSKPRDYWDNRIIYFAEPNTTIKLNSLKEIFKYGLYVSIDKDVLDISIVRTNWDQGRMKEDSLFRWLREIKDSGKILGVDFCGDSGENYILDLMDVRNKAAHKRINEKIINLFTNNNNDNIKNHSA